MTTKPSRRPSTSTPRPLLTQKEIADRLGITRQAVSICERRALRKLRAALSDLDPRR